MKYSHLNNHTIAVAGGYRRSGRARMLTWRAGYSEGESGEGASPLYSAAHYIATSEQARHNPVLAFNLIKQNVSLKAALNRLEHSPRALSHFTVRKMEQICPGWELMTDEAQNLEAFHYGFRSNDSNGYTASIAAARVALDKFVEPYTIDDFPLRTGNGDNFLGPY